MGRPGGMKGGLPSFGTTSSSQDIMMVLQLLYLRYRYYCKCQLQLQQIGIPHRHWLLYNNPPCYKITMPSYTTVTCNLIIKFRHVSEIDDLLRIGYLRYRSKFSYPMPV